MEPLELSSSYCAQCGVCFRHSFLIMPSYEIADKRKEVFKEEYLPKQNAKPSERRPFLVQLVRDQLALGRTLADVKTNLMQVFEEDEIDSAIAEFKSTDSRFREAEQLATLHDEPNYAGWYGGSSEATNSAWIGLKRALAESGWSEAMIDNLDIASTGIVHQLAPPNSQHAISVKGLVLGYVQSGKTANYSAVIAKAVDAGYRLIVVLAGMHNILRQQTQTRLKQELVDPNPARCTTLTTVDENGDFQKRQNVTASRALSVEGFTLVVLKKNSSVLRNFSEWLQSAALDVLKRTPTLIIDDESDQASINTAKAEDDPTAINSHIRKLLSRFHTCSFVGYTATPFANVLVNAKENTDIFPRDFLISLSKPPSYFGAEELFGREKVGGLAARDGLSVIRIIPPEDSTTLSPTKLKSEIHPNQSASLLVPSIRLAIDSFILACAARYVRGQHKKHMTMLLHVSHLTDTQGKLKLEVDKHVQELKFQSENNESILTERLLKLWNEDFMVVAKDFSAGVYPEFEKIWKYSRDFIEQLDTVLENNKSLERLTFDTTEPIRAIVIGGNTLSRGLTLHGLTVSYFVRSSKAYDTLLQMGRWFGYRPGYIDLTRIFVSETLRDHFYHLATVEQEIRDEIKMMAANEERPIDVGLRIRNHPSLTVTAPNKMRRATDCSATFSGTKIQARHIAVEDREIIDSNYRAIRSLFAGCRKYGIANSSLFQDHSNAKMFRGLSEEVILQFLDGYLFSPENGKFTNELLRDYITTQGRANELKDWSVAFLSSKTGHPVDIGEGSINVFDRSILRREYDQNNSGNVQLRALSTPGDELIDLGDLIDGKPTKLDQVLSSGRERESEIALRRRYRPRERGLLLVYPLNWKQTSEPRKKFSLTDTLTAPGPVFGIAFVFPFAGEDQSKYGFLKNATVTGPNLTQQTIPAEILAPQSLRKLVEQTVPSETTNTRLSKSQYVKGRKCLKRLWLYKNRNDLADAPTESQQMLFAQGNDVGILARTYFKDGVLIHEDHRSLDAALEHTRLALTDPSISYIYEGAFLYDEVIVRVDIVRKNPDGSVDLIEVKSTNSVKKEHWDDVAIQKFVIENSGVNVKQTILMHLNPDYVRNGAIDLSGLFSLDPVDEEIEELLAEVPNYIRLMRSKLVVGVEPSALIGSVCKNPYPCEFQSYCWKDVTATSIHRLSRITDKKREELKDLGVESLSKIPSSFSLSPSQKAQVESAKQDKPLVDHVQIAELLKTLEWPLHFLDYETISFPIPKYVKTSPYQQLPFQFSLHIQESEGAELRHCEFLHMEDTDPRERFVEHLLQSIDGDKGSIIVYHASFERGITLALVQSFPELTGAFEEIAGRLWDLETPFLKSWYADYKLEGSTSIKHVLPTLVPDLSYEHLEIRKGDIAQKRYVEMISAVNPSDRKRTADALLAYCKLDTLAMVKIIEKLSVIVRNAPLTK
jgi:hypothetical protein